MAEQSGVSKSTVQRWFSLFAIQPHRQRYFKLSNDPFFVEKVRDIVGLYLNPPAPSRDRRENPGPGAQPRLKGAGAEYRPPAPSHPKKRLPSATSTPTSPNRSTFASCIADNYATHNCEGRAGSQGDRGTTHPPMPRGSTRSSCMARSWRGQPGAVHRTMVRARPGRGAPHAKPWPARPTSPACSIHTRSSASSTTVPIRWHALPCAPRMARARASC